ncbi:hypothetical protein L249_2211 [Ophiocordyceps polyrhachis-furcata BCC 54312]|uniref:Cysteine-rich PDZ-binding protein n=1 Tax=Ophiocordyceps polyrhachis-furcata BCC 54312 TaxID=1330021 RepID=A0A367LQK1_9HYPO|nr:hypothetical protein L249_2211 [Ophiocordyceps polyrhachis-furcata BCC 54312]
MVCAKCQKLESTILATPEVKKKSEIYYGSPASSSSKTAGASKSTTLGQTGITKSKLLSKSAKNPYAQYSRFISVLFFFIPQKLSVRLTNTASSCTKCKTKITQSHALCQTCAYKNDACAMCGKPNKKATSTAPVVAGQKFTLK